MVKRALIGPANTQGTRPSRLAMTPDVMWLLKTKLAKATIPLVKKRLLWWSEAFLNYCKLGRGNRLNDQAKLMEDMANTAQKWISGGILVH